MTREIKFRGMRSGIGGWVYGFLVESEGTTFISVQPLVDWRPDAGIYTVDGLDEVDHATVGQYTGLKDKNGVEIYEGDIVQHHNESEYTKEEYWNPVYHLFYRPTKLGYKFIGKGKAPDCFLFTLEHRQYELEVIGNIHENPELLR